MVSGGFDKRVMLWSLDHEMSQIPLQGHQDWVNTVEGNIEGTRVLSGCRDGTIRYWNIENIGKIPLVQVNLHLISRLIITILRITKKMLE